MRLLILISLALSSCTLGIPSPTCAPTEHETPSGECVWLDPIFDDDVRRASYDVYDDLTTAMDLPEGYLIMVVRDGDTVSNSYENLTGLELPPGACVNGFNTEEYAMATKVTVVHELLHVELLHQGWPKPDIQGDTWLSDSFESAHSPEFGWTEEHKDRQIELSVAFDAPLSTSLCTP